MKPCVPLLAVLTLLAAGCDYDFGSDSEPEKDRPATEILEIRQAPNPVSVGETVRFTCVIKDSLTSGFSYHWGIEVDGRLFEVTTTQDPHYEFVFNDDSDRVEGIVQISRRGDFDEVTERFEIHLEE